MKQRPLLFGFLGIIILIIILKAAGLPLWGGPDLSKEIRDTIESDTVVAVSGTVIDKTEKADYISYILSDTFLLSDSASEPVSVHKVKITDKNIENLISIGSRVHVTGDLEAFQNASNPGGFDRADYYAGEDMYFYMYSSDIKTTKEPAFSAGEYAYKLKKKIRRIASSAMQEDQAEVLCAMLLGDKSSLPQEIKLDYSAAGLSHLLAISGVHIMILGMLLYRGLLALRIKIVPSAIISIGLMSIYCIFSGGSESTIRACIMYGIMMTGKCILKSYDPLNALAISGIIMLSIRPALLFRAGFQLSFSACFAICCLYFTIRNCFDIKAKGGNASKKIKDMIFSAALLWFCVTLTTMPLLLYNYYEFSLFSFLGNLIFVPFMGIVLIAGMAGIAAGAVFLPAGAVLLYLPGLILKTQDSLGGFIRTLPDSMLITGRPEIWQLLLYLTGMIVFILMLKNKTKLRYMLLPAALFSMIFINNFNGLSITVLDTGQGDCSVVRYNDSCYVIDGGSSSKNSTGRYTIVPYLKSQGISHIDAVFLSHADEDHMNGLTELFEMTAKNETKIKTDRLIMPLWLRNDPSKDAVCEAAREAGCSVLYASRGDKVTDGELIIRVISPDEDEGFTGNEGSLVLELKKGGFKALFAGDVEGGGEERLIERAGKCNLYKVAHHGSKYTNSVRLLEKLSPEAAVITAPAKSLYGHPHKETIERLTSEGIVWFQTGISGAVTVKVYEDGFDLEEYLR